METSLCLENLKVNDEVVVIRKTKNKLSYGIIYVISGWNNELERWNFHHPNFPEKISGRFPLNGYGYDFMSKRIHPNFYYSANQKHVKMLKTFI